MKAIMRVKAAVILFSLIGISFASCINDDNTIEPNKPVKVEDVVGDYSGKSFTVQGRWMNEQNVLFKVNDSVISFDNLPVREIVHTVVKDIRKTEEILNKMEKVKYSLSYTSALDETGTVVLLTFSPNAIEFSIPLEGETKKVKAIVTTVYKGAYVSNRYDMMKFEWAVEKIMVDGEEEKEVEVIQYYFPGSVKRSVKG